MCVDETLDPGALDGAGEHTLLPGHIRELSHYGGFQVLLSNF